MEHLISVCVPTYNGEKYFQKCLESVRAQTLSDLEIIVVDDCSSDKTLAIARAHADQDSRIRLVQNDHNLGLVGNWNRCIEFARGDWIKFVFQDDILEPDCVEKMLAACNSHTSMIVCRRELIFEDISRSWQGSFCNYVERYNMDRMFPDMTEISPEDFCKAVVNNLLGNFIGEPTAVMLHRSVFPRFGRFNQHMIHKVDLEFWIRVGSHTGLIYVPETLAHFRVHNHGATAANESLRPFRKNVLDALVCYHEFLFHPVYARLRCFASNQDPPINLEELFISALSRAHELAEGASKNSSGRNLSYLDELNEVMRLYPAMRLFERDGSSSRYRRYKRKIGEILKYL